MDPHKKVLSSDDLRTSRTELQVNGHRFFRQNRRNSSSSTNHIYNQQFNYYADPHCRLQSGFYRHPLLSVGNWNFRDRDRTRYLDPRQITRYIAIQDECQNRLWMSNFDFARGFGPSHQRWCEPRNERNWRRNLVEETHRYENEIPSQVQNNEYFNRGNDSLGGKFQYKSYTTSPSVTGLRNQEISMGTRVFARSVSTNNLFEMSGECTQTSSIKEKVFNNRIAENSSSFNISTLGESWGKQAKTIECKSSDEVDSTASSGEKLIPVDCQEKEKWNWFSVEEQELIVKLLREVDIRHEKQLEKDIMLDQIKVSSIVSSPGDNKNSNSENSTHQRSLTDPDCHGDDAIDEDSSSSDDGIVIILPPFSLDRIPELATTVASPESTQSQTDVNVNNIVTITGEIDSNWGKYCSGWEHRNTFKDINTDTSTCSNSSPNLLSSDSSYAYEDSDLNEALSNELKKLLGIPDPKTECSSGSNQSIPDLSKNVSTEEQIEENIQKCNSSTSFSPIPDVEPRDHTIIGASPLIDIQLSNIQKTTTEQKVLQKSENARTLKDEAICPVRVSLENRSPPSNLAMADLRGESRKHYINISQESTTQNISMPSPVNSYHKCSETNSSSNCSAEDGNNSRIVVLENQHKEFSERCVHCGPYHSFMSPREMKESIDCDEATANLKRLLGVCPTKDKHPHHRSSLKIHNEERRNHNNSHGPVEDVIKTSSSEVLKDILGIPLNGDTKSTEKTNNCLSNTADAFNSHHKNVTRDFTEKQRSGNTVVSTTAKQTRYARKCNVKNSEDTQFVECKVQPKRVSNQKGGNKKERDSLLSNTNENTKKASDNSIVAVSEKTDVKVEQANIDRTRPAKKRKNKRKQKVNTPETHSESRIESTDNCKIIESESAMHKQQPKNLRDENKMNRTNSYNLRSNQEKERVNHNTPPPSYHSINYKNEDNVSKNIHSNRNVYVTSQKRPYYHKNELTDYNTSKGKDGSQTVASASTELVSQNSKIVSKEKLSGTKAATSGQQHEESVKTPGQRVNKNFQREDTEKIKYSTGEVAVNTDSPPEKLPLKSNAYVSRYDSQTERKNRSYFQQSIKTNRYARKNNQNAKANRHFWPKRTDCPSKETKGANDGTGLKSPMVESPVLITDKKHEGMDDSTAGISPSSKAPLAQDINVLKNNILLGKLNGTILSKTPEIHPDLEANTQHIHQVNNQQDNLSLFGRFGSLSTKKLLIAIPAHRKTQEVENVNDCKKLRSFSKENILPNTFYQQAPSLLTTNWYL